MAGAVNFRLLWPVSGLAIVLLGGCGRSQPAVQTHASAAWAPVDCASFAVDTAADRDIRCGYVTVPRRHASSDGPTIQLATVVLPAISAERHPDPLFMAEGGPGR